MPQEAESISAVEQVIAKWRCRVCTFLNVFSSGACTRCREPVTDNDKEQLKVPVSVAAAFQPSQQSAAGTSARPAFTGVTVAKPFPTESKRSSASKLSSKGTTKIATPGAKSANIHGFTAKGKAAGSSVSPADAGKAGLPAVKWNDRHKGDLGYKASKANVHSFVHSKLNHDTASYRAKFEKEPSAEDSKGANIHSISDLTKNGFVSSVSRKSGSSVSNAYTRHEATAAPRPAKYRSGGSKGKSGGGLLAMLQAAADPSAIASLKHTGVVHQPTTKGLGAGQYTKLAL